MKHKSFTITLLALLALLLSVGGVTGQGPEPEGDVSAAATVDNLISYQGRLTEGGSPVTGNRDMTFRFYSDSSCSTQVGGSYSRPGVTVTDSLFSVKLGAGFSHFDGQGLWLGVDVGNTGTNIICEEILPVPYALSLRPGAVISDAGSHVELNRYVKGTPPLKYGVYAVSEGAAVSNYGLYGLASDTSGTAYGVYGRSDSTSGRGVYGYATASIGTASGVYGQSDSTSGRGVYGMSNSGYGVVGESNSSYGVYALSYSGVGMRAVSNSDTAVWAETSGGFAAVDGHNTTGYGV